MLKHLNMIKTIKNIPNPTNTRLKIICVTASDSELLYEIISFIRITITAIPIAVITMPNVNFIIPPDKDDFRFGFFIFNTLTKNDSYEINYCSSYKHYNIRILKKQVTDKCSPLRLLHIAS